MRYTLLIALREFAENAKTKGFWIGLFMLPLILAISIGVATKLANSEPSRYFVVIDESGAFAEPIEQSIESQHQRFVLQALGQYARKTCGTDRSPKSTLQRTRLPSTPLSRPEAKTSI